MGTALVGHTCIWIEIQDCLFESEVFFPLGSAMDPYSKEELSVCTFPATGLQPDFEIFLKGVVDGFPKKYLSWPKESSQ